MKHKHYDKYVAFGLNVAFCRRKKELTQEVLAEKVGISRTHLSNIESPTMDKSLSLQVLFDIADALEVDIEKLFEIR